MKPSAIIAAMLAQRSSWVEIAEGKRVQVRRPPETEVGALVVRGTDGKITGLRAELPEVRRYVVGWEGFSECDLVEGGASDPVEFHPDIWAVYVEDRRDVVNTVAARLIDMVLTHEKAVLDTAKN